MLHFIGFDLDGTIGDSLPLCIDTFRRVLLHFTGKSFTDTEITRYFGIDEIGLFRNIIPQHAEEAFEEYCRLFEELHKTWCPAPFPGAIDILDRLKTDGYTLFVVTGKGRRCCDITLSQYGIAHYFDYILTGSPLSHNKADNLRLAMTHFHAAPQEMLYIGDALGDAQAAAEVRVPCISAAWQPGGDYLALEAINPGNVCRDIARLYSDFIVPKAE